MLVLYFALVNCWWCFKWSKVTPSKVRYTDCCASNVGRWMKVPTGFGLNHCALLCSLHCNFANVSFLLSNVSINKQFSAKNIPTLLRGRNIQNSQFFPNYLGQNASCSLIVAHMLTFTEVLIAWQTNWAKRTINSFRIFLCFFLVNLAWKPKFCRVCYWKTPRINNHNVEVEGVSMKGLFSY